jgi:hypothetical protein
MANTNQFSILMMAFVIVAILAGVVFVMEYRSQMATGKYVDVNTLNMIQGGLYACYYDDNGNFVQAIKSYANNDLIVMTRPPAQCPDIYSPIGPQIR